MCLFLHKESSENYWCLQKASLWVDFFGGVWLVFLSPPTCTLYMKALVFHLFKKTQL